MTAPTILFVMSCLAIGSLSASPSFINVMQEGVIADGKSVQSEQINNLITRLSAQGGGALYFPPGEYLCGTIYLKDNITLYLEANAVILGSARMEDYEPSGLIRAVSVSNVALLGKGTIDGRNHLWWVDHRLSWTEEEYENHPRRRWSWVPHHVNGHPGLSPGTLVRFEDCQNVTIRDVTLKDSENWNLHILGCQGVTIDGIRIRSDLLGPNSDGIDIESSQDVTVSDCEVYSGDDAICLKNGSAKYNRLSCKNITVSNCIITTTCNGFKIGTETHGDFENITFSNSVIKAALPDEPLAKKAAETLHPDALDNGLAPIAGIALESVDGGKVRGVAISNIIMHGVRTPIFIRLGNRGGKGAQKVDNPQPGSLSDLHISNVVAYDAVNASSIMGIPGHPVKNVSMSNIFIHTDGNGTKELVNKEMPEKIDSYPTPLLWGRMPVYGMYIRHADGILLNNIQILADGPDQRPLLACVDVENLCVDQLITSSNVIPDNLIHFSNVRKAGIINTFNQTRSPVWINVNGSGSRDIKIQRLFSGMANVVEISDEVEPGEIRY